MTEPATTDRAAGPPPPSGSLSGPQTGVDKAAILLLTLGAETATGIFKHLSESEVRALSQAMARIRTIPRRSAAAVHEEAWRWLSSREGYLVDGEDFVRRLIATVASSRVGHEQQAMRELARRTEPSAPSIGSRLEGVPADAIAKVLVDEHPQVTALVVANLAPRQAADVLVRLPEAAQTDVVYRIAELRAVPEEVLTDVGNAVVGQVERLGASAQSGVPTGGAKLAADIMNLVGHHVEERILAKLDDQAPQVADTIRGLMLTFEDLHRLDNRGMQTLLKEVGRDDLLLAMKTASPVMQDRILANLSLRARDIMQEDLATLGPVRLKDVERAQTAIVLAARRLAEEQKIQLGLSLDDAVV
jgi:flagellar motor switch protein FliG